MYENILTIFHIQRICSRRLWKYLGKQMTKPKFNLWIELKTLWQNEELFIMSISSFCYNVFKSLLLQRCQKASTWWKGWTLSTLYLTQSTFHASTAAYFGNLAGVREITCTPFKICVNFSLPFCKNLHLFLHGLYSIIKQIPFQF